MTTIEFNTKSQAIKRQSLIKKEYRQTKVIKTTNNKYVVIFNN